MANEFLHTAVGAVLTQAEFELADGNSHSFNAQATGDMLYASSAAVLRRLAITAGVLVGSQDSATIPSYSRNLGSGFWGINETANANMTNGLTINQGASDDEILTLKSSDVAHGVTGTTETDTYLMIRKRTGDNGSPEIYGFDDTANEGITIHAITATTSTTHTAGGTAGIRLDAKLTNGTGVQAVSAQGNLLAVLTNGSARFIVDTEGDLFADGSDVTVYDELDDIALVRAYDLNRADKKHLAGVIRSEWDGFISQNEDDLIALGILGGRLNEGGLTNYTRLAQLHNGALWQLGKRLMEAERRMLAAETKLMALTPG